MLGAVAAVVSLIAAVLPGTIATSVLAALSSGGLTEPIGAAAIRTNAGDWSGGYIVVAFVIVAAGAWAFATLVGWALVTASPPTRMPPAAAARPWGSGSPGGCGRPRFGGARGCARSDDWLVVQPQLMVVLGGAILAILLFQLIH